MSQDDKDRFANMSFTIEFGTEEVELNSHIIPDEGKTKESFYVTDMIFERRNGD